MGTNTEEEKDLVGLKNINSEIDSAENESKKKIAEIEKEIYEESKNISIGIEELEQEENIAENDFEKLIIEEADKDSEEEN